MSMSGKDDDVWIFVGTRWIQIWSAWSVVWNLCILVICMHHRNIHTFSEHLWSCPLSTYYLYVLCARPTIPSNPPNHYHYDVIIYIIWSDCCTHNIFSMNYVVISPVLFFCLPMFHTLKQWINIIIGCACIQANSSLVILFAVISF